MLTQNQLEVHEELHNEHELKLTIILVIVGLHLAITVYKIYGKHVRTQALKTANLTV